MDMKKSTPHTSWMPTKPVMNAATLAAHAPDASVDPDGDKMEMKLPDTMTKMPKLPKIDGMGHDAAHAHNTSMHSDRFGTDTEKKMHKDMASAHYPGMGDDCPSY